MKLLLLSLLTLALSGGVDRSFASENGRKLFLIELTREGSTAVTSMHIRAENLDEARSQAVLNGWRLIGIKEVESSAPSAENFKFKYNGQNDRINGSGKKSAPLDKDYSDPARFNAEAPASENGTGLALKDGAIASKNGADDKPKDDKLVSQKAGGATLPDNSTAILKDENYRYIATLYFGLGEYETSVPDDFLERIKDIKLDNKFLVLGHTDTVPVVKNKYFDNNPELSELRAKFLRSFLSSKGISNTNVNIKGMGTLMPVKENLKEGQPMNRRADLYERK